MKNSYALRDFPNALARGYWHDEVEWNIAELFVPKLLAAYDEACEQAAYYARTLLESDALIHKAHRWEAAVLTLRSVLELYEHDDEYGCCGQKDRINLKDKGL